MPYTRGGAGKGGAGRSHAGMIGKEVVDFAAFDREGLAVAVFQEFTKRKKRFATVLKENQYSSVDDFQMTKGSRRKTYKKNPKTGKVAEQILECNT